MSYCYESELIYGIKIDKCVDEVDENELEIIVNEWNAILPECIPKIKVHLTGDYVSGHDMCYYIGVLIDLDSIEINNSIVQLNEFVKQYDYVFIDAKLYNTYTYV